MGTMPMKIPKNTAAAARLGSSLSFSKGVMNFRARASNLRITWWPFHGPLGHQADTTPLATLSPS
jgi:hypothetical protein